MEARVPVALGWMFELILGVVVFRGEDIEEFLDVKATLSLELIFWH